ncbi:MAG TPA: DUF4595 domain-containing protein [Prevotella sp.]
MKQILKAAFFAVVLLGATATFTSCGSNDDNQQGGTVQAGTDVNPLKVFTGGLPVSLDGATLTKNAKGQVTAIKTKDETVTFEYKDAATRATAAAPQVVMTIQGSEEKLVCNLYLGSDGFVKHCDETETYKGESPQKETWDFTYNSDGQLLTMLRSEGGNERTIVKYNGGNIVEVTNTSDEKPGDKDICKISYTSKNILSPIPNKGCLMIFDEIFDIDMDEMIYAYYAGLLGKATKHLPISCVDEGGDEDIFTWIINAQGYPTSLEYDNDKYTFTW